MGANGLVYNGEWLEGKYHGAGILVLPDGQVKRGFFNNGRLAH